MSYQSYNSQNYPTKVKIGKHIFPVEYFRTVSDVYLEKLEINQDSIQSKRTSESERLSVCSLPTKCSEDIRTGSETSTEFSDNSINENKEAGRCIASDYSLRIDPPANEEDSEQNVCDFSESHGRSGEWDAPLSVCPSFSRDSQFISVCL